MRRIRVGWSRSKVTLPPGAKVVDVGSGAFPHPRADVIVDAFPDVSDHRNGRPLAKDGRLVVADVINLPFCDGAFGFAIASHVAEHVLDPDRFCGELSRVASAGYIETPSPLGDYLLEEEYHLWRVSKRKNVLHFAHRPPKAKVAERLTDWFYAVYNAGREGGGKRVFTLPRGTLGRFLALCLLVLRGSLNRSGVFHTRYGWGRSKPMRFEVK